MGFEKRVALSGRATLSAQCTVPHENPLSLRNQCVHWLRNPHSPSLSFGVGRYKGCGGQPFLWLAK